MKLCVILPTHSPCYVAGGKAGPTHCCLGPVKSLLVLSSTTHPVQSQPLAAKAAMNFAFHRSRCFTSQVRRRKKKEVDTKDKGKGDKQKKNQKTPVVSVLGVERRGNNHLDKCGLAWGGWIAYCMFWGRRWL